MQTGGTTAAEHQHMRQIYMPHVLHPSIASRGQFLHHRHQRIDFLRVFDNSENFGRPHMVLSMVRGVPGKIAAEVPAWLETALEHSRFEIDNLRGVMRGRSR